MRRLRRCCRPCGNRDGSAGIAWSRATVSVPTSLASNSAGNSKVGLQSAGVTEARHGVFLFSDDNVLSPPERLLAHVTKLQQGYSLVSAVVIATGARGFWAAVDALFMHGFSRLQRAGARLGYAGVIGKSMMLRRQDLERVGGLPSTASTLCEDAACGLWCGHGGRTGLSVQAISAARDFGFRGRHRPPPALGFLRFPAGAGCVSRRDPPMLAVGRGRCGGAAPAAGAFGGTGRGIDLGRRLAAEAFCLRVLVGQFPMVRPSLVGRELLLPLLACGRLVPGRIRWRGRHSRSDSSRRNVAVAYFYLVPYAIEILLRIRMLDFRHDFGNKGKSKTRLQPLKGETSMRKLALVAAMAFGLPSASTRRISCRSRVSTSGLGGGADLGAWAQLPA